MNAADVGTTIALIKSVGIGEVGQAIAAAEAAEAAAATAASHNYGVSVSGTTLVFTPNT